MAAKAESDLLAARRLLAADRPFDDAEYWPDRGTAAEACTLAERLNEPRAVMARRALALRSSFVNQRTAGFPVESA